MKIFLLCTQMTLRIVAIQSMICNHRKLKHFIDVKEFSLHE